MDVTVWGIQAFWAKSVEEKYLESIREIDYLALMQQRK